MKIDARIYVAGHQGLVGSALMRRLEREGHKNIITRTFELLDLRVQLDVQQFFAEERPEYVFLAAAKVGGILANWERPAEFLYDNLIIQANVIDAAHRSGVKKLLFLGSSCIYPRDCLQPIKEESLLSGQLEPTNEPYAVAKIAGIKLCQAYNRQYGTNFISCMPTNLYGPHDNFDLNSSHVIPALISKLCHACVLGEACVTIWGSGKPRREFLFVDDLADALVFLMKQYDGNDIVNIGTGQDVTIAEVAETIKKFTGFTGELVFDTNKPDGTPRKLLDVSRMEKLGWSARTSLEDGIKKTVDWYRVLLCSSGAQGVNEKRCQL